MKWKFVLPAIAIVVAAAVLAAFFVPITVGGKDGEAKPGSPSYTEALTSGTLPPMPPRFDGEIKRTASNPGSGGLRRSRRPRAHPASCSS